MVSGIGDCPVTEVEDVRVGDGKVSSGGKVSSRSYVEESVPLVVDKFNGFGDVVDRITLVDVVTGGWASYVTPLCTAFYLE